MIVGISGKIGSGKDTIANILLYLTSYYHGEAAKDCMTFSEWIKESHGDISSWQVKKFAGKLKQIVALLIGCTLEDLEDQDFKSKPLGEAWDKYQLKDFMKVKPVYFSTFKEGVEFCRIHNNSQHCYTVDKIQMTPRLMLQLIGTEGGRDLIHPNLWINSLFTEYYQTKMVAKDDKLLPNWIITDVRFENEAKAIKDKGGYLIRINRPINQQIDKAIYPYKQEHEYETALDNYNDFNHIVINDGSIEDLVEKVKQLNIV